MSEIASMLVELIIIMIIAFVQSKRYSFKFVSVVSSEILWSGLVFAMLSRSLSYGLYFYCSVYYTDHAILSPPAKKDPGVYNANATIISAIQTHQFAIRSCIHEQLRKTV